MVDSGYWYGENGSSGADGARRVLQALRLFQAADAAMRRRTRDSMAMTENALLTLRYLLRQPARQATPAEITHYLGISVAGTTTLLDALSRSGHIERQSDPDDPRGIRIRATERSDDEVRATLTVMHERMFEAADGMSVAETDAVLGFLQRMQDAVDSVSPEPEPTAHPG